MTILILCTGNSCRSQMAQGFLQSLSPNLKVFSAGTHPSQNVHPKAVAVMQEIGIDIAHHTPTSVTKFLSFDFDYVITVCDDAKDSCPAFSGKTSHRLHIGFDDPAQFKGTEEETLTKFRTVRDQIIEAFTRFYKNL